MKPHPDETEAARAERLAREAREADALRENLRRRKEQARTRQAPAPCTPPENG